MERQWWLAVAADLTLLVHLSIVLFIVGGLILIYMGNYRGWRWVTDIRFRIAHLAAIAMVIIQSWLGIVCPLTTLEMYLRRQAGDTTYEGAFIAHWLGELLYFQAPAWIFTLAYTLFGGLVVASWFWVRPQARKKLADMQAS